MKRKALLFALLLAFFAPWAANAQETLTVYDNGGTTTNANVPFWGTWADNSLQCEMVYPATELSQMENGTITNLHYYTNGSDNIPTTSGTSNWDGTFQIFMKEVAETTITEFTGTTDATIVYEGQIPLVNGEMTIELSTPYSYGGGNLLVGFYYTTGGHWKTANWYGESVTGASIYGRSGQNYSVNNGNFLPMTTFTYEPGGDCPKPTTLVASNVTTHTAVLTWEGEASEYGFNLEYKKASEVEWTRIGLGNTTFSYTLNGNHALDPETVYNARVQAVCDLEDDNNNSGWRETSFTTDVACPAPTGLAVAEASITANEATATWTGTSQSYVVMIGEAVSTSYTADFETGDLSQANFTTTTSYPWTVIANTHSGAYCAKSYSANSQTSALELEVTLNQVSTISFSAKVSSEANYDMAYFSIDGTVQSDINGISGAGSWIDYSYELAAGTHTLRWYYTKDGSVASNDDCFYVDDITFPVLAASSWTEYTTTNQTYTFENLTPNTPYQVKVKGNCGSDGYSTETAPVSFTTLVSCPAPTHITVTDITAHSAKVSWDKVAQEPEQITYEFLCVEHGETPDWTSTGLVYVFDRWYNQVIPSFTPSGLAPETEYDYYIRRSCGAGDYSEVITGSFTTLVACPAPTDFEVDEESITGHTATLEWNGTSESYTVYYRTKAYVDGGVEEGFSDAPSGWIFRTGALNTDGTASLSGSSSWSNGYSNGVFDSHIYMNLYNTKNYWLITPSMDINNGDALSFDMAYTAYSGTQATPAPNCTTHRFAVLISTDDMTTWTILREWNNNGSEDVLDNVSQTGENVSISLASYAGRTAYIAFFGHSETTSYDNNFHFDNVTIGTLVAAGEWLTAEPEDDATSVELTSLSAETTYEAKVQGDCGEEGLSAETELITFTTDITCPAPTGFVFSHLKSSHVDLMWDSDAHSWQLCLNDNEEDLINIDEDDVIINNVGDVIYTLTGLTEQTPYTVKLRANCGEEGFSAWSDPLGFTTTEACPTPWGVYIDNIHHDYASVFWVGESESFTVKYRTTAGIQPIFSEGFENGIGNWTMRNCSTSTGVASSTSYAHSGNAAFCFVYNTNPPQYLISPELTGVTNGMKLEFYYKNTSSTYPETFQIGFSSTDDETASFEFGEEYEAADEQWHLYSETIPAGTKYICWQLNSNDKLRLCIDDVVVGADMPAGEWETVTTTDEFTNIIDLTPGTRYEVVVVPSCNEENVSESVFFTSLPIKHFVTEGEWNVANNWSPVGLPEEGDDVFVDAPATIPGDYLANVGHITLGTNGAITIADGGQLRHTNASTDGVTVTLEKIINGYDNMNVKSGYYFISPAPFIQTISPNSVENLKSNDYDLYSFNAAASDGLEWRNLHDSNTSLKSAHGYLYANSETVTLKSTGLALSATSGGASLSIQYDPNAGYDFNGWELAGNPYVCNGYVYIKDVNNEIVETDFYRMNEYGDGYDLISSTEPLKPYEGVLVHITGEQGQYSISFSPDPIESNNNGKLNMSLSHNGNRIDMARVRFGEGQNLDKMNFRENSSKVYFPIDGKDYAMVYSEGMGEMPVNFKAENNGSYTLSFNAEEVSFAYLHLIDNMTGIDTDLLSTPSYSFEAKTTDYASRFKLIFVCGNANADNENFAFFNNGSFVINNEGQATLQVVDVMGRIIKSETINGCANVNVNAAAGVYVLRLVNGENVKVQKVVVR